MPGIESPIASKHLLFVFLICLNSLAFSQSITLNLHNAPLESIFQQIENQSPFRFVYSRETLATSLPVTIIVRNVPLQQVLSRIFDNQPLAYTIDQTFISVWRKPLSPVDTPATYTLKGRIHDEHGEAVPGVTVAVNGKSIATATVNDGSFLLTGIEQQDILTISCIGYHTKEILLSGKSFLEETLLTAIDPMAETVVIAYGTTTKKLNTGTIAQIKAAQLGLQPAGNPLTALQGRISGLYITQNSGLPGSYFSILVRGRNSIQNGTAPLYIIDGVPFLSDADRLTQRSQINANSPFNSISLSGIQSIEVLKDADATALYGSRGANGVIAITTQKAGTAKKGLDVSLYTGWGKAPSTAYMNTAQYLQMRREAFQNDNNTPTITDAPDLLLWDTTRYLNWKQLLIGGTARLTNSQLRFTGGNTKIAYSISSGYYKETTVFPGDAYMTRQSLDGSLHYHPNHHVTLDIQSGYSANNSLLYQQDLTSFLPTVPNAPPPYNAAGALNWSENGADYLNPMAALLKTYNVKTNRITAGAQATYQLGHVRVHTSLGYNTMCIDEHYKTPISSQNPALNPKGIAGFALGNTRNWIAEPYLEYTDTFWKKLSTQLLVGLSWQEVRSNTTDTRATGYTDDRLLNTPYGAASVTTLAYDAQIYRYQSQFARVKANWDKKYLLSLSLRNDGSSRFGPENGFARFGAIGAGWILSEEKFWPAKNTALSFGKLKASLGTTGNDAIGDYQFLDSWSTTAYPYANTVGLYPERIANPGFSWEQKTNIEGGLELGGFNNRVILSITGFRSRSNRQIIRYALPYQTGFSNVLKNIPAVIQNSGIELELYTTVPVSKFITWEGRLNITKAQNRLKSFPGLRTSSYAGSLSEGKSLTTMKGYRFVGVDPHTGRYVFEDSNKDGQLNTLDFIDIGNTDPLFFGGMQHTFSWRGWTLDCFFQFIHQKGRDMIYGNSQRPGQMFNQPLAVTQRWTAPGNVAPFQQYTQSPSNPAFIAGGLVSSSGAVLTDASFAKLKNLMLSYSLNKKWTARFKLQKAKLYAEAQNLVTFTAYNGPDPESQNRLTLPPLRTWVLGLQLVL